MTEVEQLVILRTMTEDPTMPTDSDEVLSAYLKMAGSKILAKAFPYSDCVEVVPPKYHSLQVEIAAYMLNKRGAEGETAHDENGIKRIYENADIPASLLKTITPYCGVFR